MGAAMNKIVISIKTLNLSRQGSGEGFVEGLSTLLEGYGLNTERQESDSRAEAEETVESVNSQRRDAVIRAVSGLKPNDASQVLASALNAILADTGTVATIHYHCLISRG